MSDPEMNDPTRRRSEADTESVDLLGLWILLWRHKWIIIAVTFVFAVLSIPYALVQTEWYRSETLLSPAEERSMSGLTRQLGGLVGLAGVSVGGGGSAEPLAILGSRDFAEQFIRDENLLPVLFADLWDADAGSWIDSDPANHPDMRDAVRIFRNDVLQASEDPTTGLVTLAVQWTDPETAAKWANQLVGRLNEHVRQRALREAEGNVAYLEQELQGSNVVTLQQSIGRLLEAEMQKLMLARGNTEFAFRVIDSAKPPKLRYKPNRVLIVVVATFLGGLLGVFGVLFRETMVTARRSIDSASG
ncbi:MAG: Wzz/FepE/Etk N-terminal domain-containing protein [Woeseiaceae bacterium]|nr:Wzz/FepE/Etk N-terminal domain-containing protein [Woeseiaceae bacterium]